ncbi:LysR family transcriptional regulator [Rhodococcus kroppenstedtii]|nr:LysR family transcriptional regulator [Rhodococcus kroppenstedtii]
MPVVPVTYPDRVNDATVLRWFLAVAEIGAFGRAARALSISRQRLSAAIRDLEADVGERVFVTDDAGTRLTPAGESLLAHARAVVADEDRRRAEPARESRRALRIGFVPGVTVTKWTRIWAERFPDTDLTTEVIEQPDQLAALRDGRVDMCFVREPAGREGLHVVPLYAEVAVVVVPKDHPVAAYDEIALADLDGESLQDAGDDVAVTLEMVAAGVGPVVIPHSLARLHSRRDLVFRPVTDAPSTQVFLAWPVDDDQDDTDLRQEFLGIVRGRSAHSSRAAAERTATSPTHSARGPHRAGGGRTTARPTPRRKRAR